MNQTFENLVSKFHTHFTSDADRRLNCGLYDGLGDLPSPGAEAATQWQASTTKLLSEFENFDASTADFDTQLDIELAMLKLKAEIFDCSYCFNDRTQAAQMPKAGEGIGDGIFMLFINDPRSDNLRLDDILGRMESIPEYLSLMLSRLEVPVKRWVDMDVEAVEELPSLFEVIEAWATRAHYPDINRLCVARKAAEKALLAYAAELSALPTTTQIHIGEELTRTIVANRGIAMSLEELHQMAVNFLAETRDTIESLRSSLALKYGLAANTSAEDLQKFLAQKYRLELPTGNVEDVLKIYEEEREKILAFIKERNLFPILTNQDMKIIRTPAFMTPTIPAGAMLPPPAFREGVRTSMVYLTLSEELMDEHTALGIPGMMIHEGIPGHHLQLATASTHQSVIRRHIDANDHAEGWTTMLEDYMLDVGYKSELVDEVRFCGKRDLSRIGARVAIDLFFMTGDNKYLDVGIDCDTSPQDPFEAAGNLLAAVTGFVPGRVQAELNWYSQERGYPLSYLTGNTIVWQMKAEIAAAQAGKLEGRELDRRFHDVYLHSGNMPLSFLHRVLVNEGLLE